MMIPRNEKIMTNQDPGVDQAESGVELLTEL